MWFSRGPASSAGALTATVDVTGGTATAGTDFTGGPYTVEFADGSRPPPR